MIREVIVRGGETARRESYGEAIDLGIVRPSQKVRQELRTAEQPLV
jgi:hypothetical protein